MSNTIPEYEDHVAEEVTPQENASATAIESETTEASQDRVTSETTASYDFSQETQVVPKKKMSKKKLRIIFVVAAVLVIVLVVLLTPSKFDKVKNECLDIAGTVGSGKNYFSLDTCPDSYENMDDTLKALLLPGVQERTLKAIKHANEALGFPGSVYSDMLSTNAIMGRQTEENSKYKVSWTYHPSRGLEVTYTKK